MCSAISRVVCVWLMQDPFSGPIGHGLLIGCHWLDTEARFSHSIESCKRTHLAPPAYWSWLWGEAALLIGLLIIDCQSLKQFSLRPSRDSVIVRDLHTNHKRLKNELITFVWKWNAEILINPKCAFAISPSLIVPLRVWAADNAVKAAASQKSWCVQNAPERNHCWGDVLITANDCVCVLVCIQFTHMRDPLGRRKRGPELVLFSWNSVAVYYLSSGLCVCVMVL